MSHMRKRVLRVIGGLVVVIVVVIGGMFLVFSSWKAEHLRQLDSVSRVMKTALGDVEYAVEGQGVPYLSIHGTRGGYDAGLAGRRANPRAYNDVMTIAVSRPGYLRTLLSSGATFEQRSSTSSPFRELSPSRHQAAATSVSSWRCATRTAA